MVRETYRLDRDFCRAPDCLQLDWVEVFDMRMTFFELQFNQAVIQSASQPTNATLWVSAMQQAARTRIRIVVAVTRP